MLIEILIIQNKNRALSLRSRVCDNYDYSGVFPSEAGFEISLVIQLNMSLGNV